MADDASVYLYEFLYRGRAPGSAEPPAYHVILAQDATDAFGTKNTSVSQAMTPEQAAAAGYPLPAIAVAINAGTMAENSGLKTQVVALETHRDDLRSARDAAVETASALQADLDAARADAEALETQAAEQIRALQTEIEGLRAQVAALTASASPAEPQPAA